MQKLLLLGDEAIAQAALDAGISGIYAYPAHHLLKLWNTYKYQKSSRQQRTSSVVCQRKNSLRSSDRNVVCRQTCHRMYEARRIKCCCRCIYECRHHRYPTEDLSYFLPMTQACTHLKMNKIQDIMDSLLLFPYSNHPINKKLTI